MYKKILVAVDFESESARLLQRARELAELHQAELVLTHVTEPAALSAAMIGPDGMGVVAEDAEMDEQLMAAAKERLAELVEDANLAEVAASVKLDVELGLPSAMLVRMAERSGADLILIGHHPRRGLAQIFGVGTDRDVLHHAPCDVLAVRTD